MALQGKDRQERKNMKKVSTVITLLMLACLALQAKGKKKAELWPDGTTMEAFFADTTKVNVISKGRQYVITDYGVSMDSAVVQTEAIQRVIDRCAEEGGGIIVIPHGTFLSGSLFFKAGTSLLVRGKLKGSDRIMDFRLTKTRMEGQTLQYFSALVNADHNDGFTIAGNGYIDGNGMAYWQEFWLRRRYNKDCTNLEAMRPRLVYISNSTVQDVHLHNSPFWTNHLYRCERARYLDCHIYAPTEGVRIPEDDKTYGAPSSDAIDLDVCHDVLISGCYMHVNDDAVVIKGGKGTWADQNPDNGPSYNILITDCHYGKVHGCLTVGSESLHDWNIVLQNIQVDNASRVLWLKMRPDTPQHYEKIHVKNIHGRCGSFLVVRPWTQFYAPGDRKDMPLSQCNDVRVCDIDMHCDKFFNVGTSDKYALQRFTFERCTVVEREDSFRPSLVTDCTVADVDITVER